MSENPFAGDDAERKSSESRPQGRMDPFFQEERELKAAIERLSLAADTIEKLKKQNMSSNDPKTERRINDNLNKTLDETTKNVKDIKNALRRLNEQTDELERAGKASESTIRVRRNSHSTLSRQFFNSLEKFQKAQSEYEAEIKSKVTRQIRIVDPTASDDKINEIFESGDPSSVIKQAIVGPVNSQVEERYREVQDKYRDVVKLVKSVHQLHQLFEDMAILVEEQGQMLDRIEMNTRQANTNVKDANTKLDMALENQKKARQLRCCIIICVIILIVVIALVSGLLSA